VHHFSECKYPFEVFSSQPLSLFLSLPSRFRHNCCVGFSAGFRFNDLMPPSTTGIEKETRALSPWTYVPGYIPGQLPSSLADMRYNVLPLAVYCPVIEANF